jgi:hypothetical protein
MNIKRFIILTYISKYSVACVEPPLTTEAATVPNIDGLCSVGNQRRCSCIPNRLLFGKVLKSNVCIIGEVAVWRHATGSAQIPTKNKLIIYFGTERHE